MPGRHSLQRNPYQELFIYYIEGRISGAPLLNQREFLGNWEEENFSFLFFSQPSRKIIEALLDAQPHLRLIDRFHMTYDEWQGGEVAPLQIGNFTIIPPWQRPDESQDGGTILLDPGLVFGSGTHPTTRDCLTAIEMTFELATIRTVIDLGTGTGVLALAAARLGAKKILAVDMNFLAAKTARRNVDLNRAGGQIAVTLGDAKNFMDLPFDLMVSNIHYDVMKNLIDAPGFGTKRFFILSGLLRSEAKDIRLRLERTPARLIESWEQGGVWHTFFGYFP